MDIQINVNIGLTKGLEQFLTQLLGGQSSDRSYEQDELARYRAQAQRGLQQAETIPSTLMDSRNALASAENNQPADAHESPTDNSPQDQAQRRTRRTKAQIEADNAAAAQATSPSSDLSNGSGETVDLLSGATSGSTATIDASPSDLAAALEQAEAPATNGAVTKEMVAAKMGAAMGIEGLSPKKIQDKMIVELDGAKNMSTLKPELYPAALALFDKIIANGDV